MADDIGTQRMTAHNERIIECVLLYTLDETIFPSPRRSSEVSADKVGVDKQKTPPPLTHLRKGPKGADHHIVPAWRGEPLRAKFQAAAPRIHECPPTGMGTPFSDLQQLSVFAFPKGVEIRTTKGDQRGLIPPLPTHRGNVFQHSFVWTNYWDEPEVISNDFMNGKEEQMKELGVEYEGCPGEDRERHYFHCATIWRPLREDYVTPVRLELGASSIMQNDEEQTEDGIADGVPTEFYEPQVIVIVTKLPYHESFGAVLRAFMQKNVNEMVNHGVKNKHLVDLYRSVCTPVNLELPPSWRRCALEDIPQPPTTSPPSDAAERSSPPPPPSHGSSPPRSEPPSSPPPPSMVNGSGESTSKNVYFFEEVSGKGTSQSKTERAATGGGKRRPFRVVQPPPGSIRHVQVGGRDIMIPSRGAAEWENDYRARCSEADMAPLLTLLQPSNVVRLFSAALLERSILVLASDSSPLFDVLEALRAILFPLTWYHIYLPALPETQFMTGQLQAPVTYLAGSTKSVEVLDNIKFENCVVADLDDDVVLDAVDYLRHRAKRKEKYDEMKAASQTSTGRKLNRLSITPKAGGAVARRSWHPSDGDFVFDENTDWRMEAWRPFNEQNPLSTLAAPLPPRYALKLHREIRRYAPLYEREVARIAALSSPHTPTSSRTMSIASFTSGNNTPTSSSRSGGGGGGGGSGGTPTVAFEPIELPQDASDSLKLLAAREASGAPVMDEASLVNAMGGSKGKRAAQKASSVVTLNVLNVIEGSSSDENMDGPEDEEPDNEDDDDSDFYVLSDKSSSNVRVVSDIDDSTPQWGSGVTSSTLQTTDWQRMRFYSLRRAFFAVLTSLLKGYREHIRTGEHLGGDKSHQKASTETAGTSGENAASAAATNEAQAKGASVGNGGIVASSDLASTNREENTSLQLDEIFDQDGFVAMRERGCDELHLKQFLDIFLGQPIFENYMHRRAAATTMDALDRAIYESRSRRAWSANHSRLVRVQQLGEAFKARMDSHSNSLWGPTSWKRRFFELHHLEPNHQPPLSPGKRGNVSGEDEAELLSLTYYELDSGLNELVLKAEELKMKEKSSRDHATIKQEREELLVEIAARKKRNKKGEMILRKGATAFQIPDKGYGVKFNGSKSSSILSSGRGTHRTAFAFEIHVHEGSNAKILTICCDTHKDRRMFIRTIQNALVTRDEVNRMRDQFLTPDAVRDLHSRLGQQRRDHLTHKITDSFPAPFQSSRSSISIFGSVAPPHSPEQHAASSPAHSASSSQKGSSFNGSNDPSLSIGAAEDNRGDKTSSANNTEGGIGNSAMYVAEEFENERSNCILS